MATGTRESLATESGVLHPRDASTARPPRRPAMVLVVGAVVAVLVAAGALALANRGSSPAAPAADPLVGKVLSGGFSLAGVNGSTVRAPWLAHHPAVVFFFSSTCALCHAELHHFGLALREPDLAGVAFVGVDGDATMASARRFVLHSNIRFPVGLDPLLELSARLVPSGSPAAVFVTASGRVVAVDYGRLPDTLLSAGLSLLRPT